MANNTIKRYWNQYSMVNIEDLRGLAFEAEDEAHTFVITGLDENREEVSLSGTVSAVFLRADNADVTITGSVSGGKVYVTLTEQCYDVVGRFGLTIYLTSNSQTVAIYAAVGNVLNTSSGVVASGTVTDVVTLVNAISAAVATIPASYTDLMAGIAPTYSNSALYAVGSYAWYSGKLYRCTTAITTAESWTSGHWTLADISQDVSNLKSEVDDVSDFVGDTDTNLGAHIGDVEKLSFSNTDRTVQTVSVKWRSNNSIEVSGTATELFLYTIQDNIILPAGNYTFSIDTAIQSDGYEIQLFNVTSNTVVRSNTKTSSTLSYDFTTSETASYRVRIKVETNAVSDTQIVSLLSEESINNTLAFATAELISDVSGVEDRVSVLEPSASASDVGKVLKAKTVSGGKVTEYEFGEGGGSSVTVDDELSTSSTNPVQNKVITGVVGTTDIGDHTENVEKLAFTTDTRTVQTVSIKRTTDNKVQVSGTASALFVQTLQDNISLSAGRYLFTIDCPIQSADYEIQLFNITANSVKHSFTKTSFNQYYKFSISESASYRVRILVKANAAVSDTQKVSLAEIKTVDNTLSWMAKNLMTEVDDIGNVVKQKCKLIEDAGNVFTVDTLIITGTNIKVKNDNSTVFSKTARRITALEDGATVKFAFGGITYEFDTVTIVFYFPYNSYSGSSPTSLELRIYANGTSHTPVLSTSNCCWGWNYLKLPRSKLGLGNTTTLTSMDMVFKKTEGTTETEFGEIIVDSIILDMKMKPTFILDFDQIWEKSIDNGAYEYCRTKNIPYTIHTWKYDNLNSAKVSEMNTAMLNGCEFSYYGGYTSELAMKNATSYSEAIAECELMENDIIPFTHRRFTTYGCGGHIMNQYLRESIEASGVKAIRGRWIQNPIGYFSNRSTWLPYSIEISYGNSTVAQIKEQIDEAIENGSCVVAFTHGVCNDDETVLGVSSSAIKLADFKEVIDYLANLRNQNKIQVCTMEQFVDQCL